MKLKIAILGTRGIPNNYGGFEHISQYISEGLVQKGHELTVYNSHNHSYQFNTWHGVNLIHCYDPEYKLGTAGQFIYDFNCLIDARKRNFDVILWMGYTSSSIWGSLYPAKSTIITNMDGLEWKRSKYSKPVQYFLKFAEKLAVKHSNFYIADSVVIKSYLQEKYHINSSYIPYGANVYTENEKAQSKHTDEYFMLMARMEPENNIETILQGFSQSNSTKCFKVLGNTENNYGKYITNRFKSDQRIQFKGANFNNSTVRFMQHNAHLYFHGHSVGGTNPSLLEAMASEALIAAHNNPFNKAVLDRNAFYFDSPEDVRLIVEKVTRNDQERQMIANNLDQIQSHFNWEKVIDAYEEFILECYTNMNYEKFIPTNR